jgi:DeoR/GlpR family transcriptional regulator of sugar metabolism
LDDRTLRRDVNALVEMGLLKKTGDGYVANRDITLPFLPRNG